MNKHIRALTDIVFAAAVILVLAAALLPASAQEPAGEITEESRSSPSPEEPQDVVTSSTTTTEPEKTSQTSETTTTTTTAENTTTPPTTVQAIETPKPSWTEQPASGVMYVNTDGISSVEVAQIGSKKMKQYSLNDMVTVVAFTNTDYYKLEDGTFIHADFLSTSETVITAEGESEPPASETDEGEEAADGEEASDSDVSASDQT